jgi:protein-tyrosine phosphatase
MNLSVISSIKNRDQISITMVCLGNICRSPMAAAVLANKKKAIQSPVITVDSAGTGPWHIGQGPHPSSKKIWEKAGYKHEHTAKQFSSNDFFVHDLILVMDSSN